MESRKREYNTPMKRKYGKMAMKTGGQRRKSKDEKRKRWNAMEREKMRK